MTATHFNVLAKRALRQQRRAPADDGVASAVHRCGRDVWGRVAPTDQGTSERDDRAHRVGSTSRQVNRVDAAQAPPDQAHRAVLPRGCEQLIETVGDMATEPAVDAEPPSVAAVTKSINEPAKWCSRRIVAAQSGQHEHGVAVAPARHRQQRTCSHRKRGELGSRSSFPSHHCRPPKTLRHASLFPQVPAATPPPAQPANRADTRRSHIPRDPPRDESSVGVTPSGVQGRSSDGARSAISRLGSDCLRGCVQKRPPSTMNCCAVQPPLSSAARKRIICANSSGRIRLLSA